MCVTTERNFAVNKNDEVKIHYKIYFPGKEKCLLLSAGRDQTNKVWDAMAPELFSGNLTIITYDHRGIGHSDKPESEYNLKDYPNDIKAILDSEGIQSANFIGLSYGGLVVQEFYNQYPEMVESLILVSTVFSGPKAIWPDESVLMKAIKPITEESTEEEKKEKFEANLKLIASKWFLKYNRNKLINFLEKTRDENYQDAQKTLFNRINALNHYTNNYLDEIKVPVLVLQGKSDNFVPAINVSEFIKIPDARIVIMRNTGHLLPLERPQEFYQEVTEHILNVS